MLIKKTQRRFVEEHYRSQAPSLQSQEISQPQPQHE